MLERYCKSVLANKKSEPVKFEIIEQLSDVKHDVLVEADTIVLNLTKFDVGIPVKVVDLALIENSICSVLILFDSDQGQFEALRYIASLSKPAGFVVRQVYFEAARPKLDQGFINNAVYGILIGKVLSFDHPVKVINGTLEKTLGNFILLISPLPAKVLFLNEGRLPIPVAHSED